MKRALTNPLPAVTGRGCITNFSIPPTFLLGCQDFKAITAQLQANYTIKKREWYHPTVISQRTTELFFNKGKSVSALLHNEPLMISEEKSQLEMGGKGASHLGSMLESLRIFPIVLCGETKAFTFKETP